MIEAMACGTPVAGYAVPGPLDIIGPRGRGADDTLDQAIGAVDDDLGRAITDAQTLNRRAVAAFGASFDWDRSTDQFVGILQEALYGDRISFSGDPTQAALGSTATNAVGEHILALTGQSVLKHQQNP